jgi:hypothetical protein
VPDEKTPIDQALDLLVFAPLGLALTARDQLPELVEKGRSQVEGQLTMAKFVGQFAVQQGKVELEKRLRAYAEPRAGAPRPAPEAASTPEPAAAATATIVEPVAAPPADAPRTNGTGPKSVDLAIHGYDSLSASQVVQRLAGLAAPELEDVRAYETANRGRKTVLSKISQLQA